MRHVAYLLACSVALLSSSPCAAQSDVCGGAPILACGAVVSGSTVGYNSDNTPFCTIGNSSAAGVWYRVVGTGGNITASLCGSGYDTRIRVYKGNCGTLTCVTGNDDYCGLGSRVVWTSVLSTTYFILVHGYGSAVGAYTLSITCLAPPAPMCYIQVNLPYAADPYTGTALNLGDDIHSPVVNIGFDFCFNGATYSQCVISSNNYISFNLANAGTYSPWQTVTVPRLTPPEIGNSILSPWQDLYPPGGGTITYQTLGVAPNRRFVVSFLNVPLVYCFTQLITTQLVLNEESNCIASFILDKTYCAASSPGAVHALHNDQGNLAIAVPGRNHTPWTSVSQGLLFVPTCVPCSTSVTTACMDVVLPVELLQFHGYTEGDANILEWATATEHNSASFIVERSADGEHFGPIAALNGAGNSTALLQYSAKDPAPLHGTNYYRLRSVDIDGAEEVSAMINVEFSPRNILYLFPNPGSGTISYRLPEGVKPPARIDVFDLSGRMVKSMVATSETGTMDIADLKAGSYSVLLPTLGAGRAIRLVVE